jgi:hypothetical protein
VNEKLKINKTTNPDKGKPGKHVPSFLTSVSFILHTELQMVKAAKRSVMDLTLAY